MLHFSSIKGTLCVLQVRWEWREFQNQGRKDSLHLRHWAKCLKDAAGNVKVADDGEYKYSKYNKKVHSLSSITHRLSRLW